jgi:hypothetical protein
MLKLITTTLPLYVLISLSNANATPYLVASPGEGEEDQSINTASVDHTQASSPTFATPSTDILISILTKTQSGERILSPEDLFKCIGVNKHWRKIGSDNRVWQHYANKLFHFDFSQLHVVNDDWYHIFIQTIGQYSKRAKAIFDDNTENDRHYPLYKSLIFQIYWIRHDVGTEACNLIDRFNPNHTLMVATEKLGDGTACEHYVDKTLGNYNRLVEHDENTDMIKSNLRLTINALINMGSQKAASRKAQLVGLDIISE